MSASYLLYTQHDQTIETQERGLIHHCVAFSHPEWYSGKVVLAADFARIAVGDVVFLCRDSKLFAAASVTEVACLHDMDGKPVRVLIGPVEHRYHGGWSITAVAKELERAGLGALRILTSRGFKQSAFCQEVSSRHAQCLLKHATPSRRAA